MASYIGFWPPALTLRPCPCYFLTTPTTKSFLQNHSNYILMALAPISLTEIMLAEKNVSLLSIFRTFKFKKLIS